MSQDYPPSFDDDQETRRRSNTPLVPSERQSPPPGPMARPVMPQADRTRAHPRTPEAPLPPEPESSGLYVPWWGFALVILAVAGLTCGLWGVVLYSRGDGATSVGPTPTVIFVISTPSATLGSQPGPIVITETPGPIGPTVPPGGGATLPPGGESTIPPANNVTPTVGVPITLGATIQVFGTEGSGLTVRQGPSRDYTFVFIANDGDKFKVQDGPKEANGFTWWYIVDPNDQNRFGWAVQDFMQVVPGQ